MFKKFSIKDVQKRKKLKTKLHQVYTGLASFIILGFAFFYTSKLFFVDAADILNTEINKELSINSSVSFTINEWIYDDESNRMQVTLLTNNMTDYLSDLKFISVSRTNLSRELPTKIVYNTRDIYIIMIEQVPKEFDQVAVRFVREEVNFEDIFSYNAEENVQNLEVKSKVLASIYADQRVVASGEVKQQKVKEYALNVTNEMIELTEIERSNRMKEIQKNTLIISKIHEEIELLKEEIIYQTIAEQDETNNKIFNLEKEIEDLNQQNSIILADVDSLDAKVKRLTQRKRDLQY